LASPWGEAVSVVRTETGEGFFFPVIQTVRVNGCDFIYFAALMSLTTLSFLIGYTNYEKPRLDCG
jgi:hypothetical protein